MAYITKNKTITINGKVWWVNSQKSGLLVQPLKKMINQVDLMLERHSKVHLIRFDLRTYQYTANNEIIAKFNRIFHRWISRHYNTPKNHIGFIWCREIETSKQQHYHYVLMLNGHKVRHPKSILNKARDIWDNQINGSEFTPKNCYYNLKREDYDSIQPAIYRISYLAKVRGKGYKPSQTKNYGTSRLKHRYIGLQNTQKPPTLNSFS